MFELNAILSWRCSGISVLCAERLPEFDAICTTSKIQKFTVGEHSYFIPSTVHLHHGGPSVRGLRARSLASNTGGGAPIFGTSGEPSLPDDSYNCTSVTRSLT